MAFLNETFDVNTLPTGNNGDFTPLPAGWYNATITKAELRDTNDKTGQYISVRYDITGPTHQGRVVFGNLNIKNKSTKAEEIGRQQLGEIMRAGGLARVSDSDQLIGLNLAIKLNILPARTDVSTGKAYEASNDVRGYKSQEGAMSAAPKVPAAAVKTAPANSPPWAK
jgi:hypothetical protein